MKVDRRATIAVTDTVVVSRQEPVEREYFCRGVRFTAWNNAWTRCGNSARYYVFSEDTDDARVAICGVCRRKAIKSTLRVVR